MDLLLAVTTRSADPVEAADPIGLARGRYPAPAWVIWVVAAGVLLLGVAIVLIRLTRARRAKAAGNAPGKRP